MSVLYLSAELPLLTHSTVNVLTRSAGPQKRNGFTPLSDRLSFFSAPFFSRLAAGSPTCLLLPSGVVRLSVPGELGSLFVYVRDCGGGKRKDRETICVCVIALYLGAVWMFSAERYWMGCHRLLCSYTKKLFCFERNNWAFHGEAESTHNRAASFKDADSHQNPTAPSSRLSLSPLSDTKVGQ